MATIKKKKLKLKKGAYILLGSIIIFIIALIFGLKFYKEYKYKQTYEYKITAIGYSLDDAKKIIDKVGDETINYILSNPKNDLIIDFINEKYFIENNLNDYLEFYKKQDDETFTDIVAMVNTHANNKWYEVTFDTDINLNEKMIVNKFYTLNKEYAPTDLKDISLDYSYGNEGDNKLLSYAYDEFMNLWQAANDAGFYLMVTSSYRNYEEQESIYEERKVAQGERKADETAARPGHSEHQTGLVVDMTSKTEPIESDFKDSKTYNWLKENAYKYGFIERYPEDKTYITGYAPESWHWRYVGSDAAKVIHDENITYDEYYAYYIEYKNK